MGQRQRRSADHQRSRYGKTVFHRAGPEGHRYRRSAVWRDEVRSGMPVEQLYRYRALRIYEAQVTCKRSSSHVKRLELFKTPLSTLKERV